MSNVLNSLIGKIEDPQLRAEISREVGLIRDNKRFGLVFERHLPEVAKLHSHPVRRGCSVKRRVQGESPDGLVTAVNSGVATVAWEDGSAEEVPSDQLVVVAQFGEPVFPGLTSLGRIERGGDKPFHAVINAENYHALETLRFTHTGKVDVIYVDVPYNLGGDLTYNDKRVAEDDAFRHSKWLSFIDRRLRLAYDLLAPTGFILVSIDDVEQAHLRLLMGQIFGESNFVATLVWKSKSGGANDSGVAVDHEYILVYGRTDQAVARDDPEATVSTSYAHADEVGPYSLERLDKQSLTYSASLDYDLVGPDGEVYKLSHRDPSNPNANWRWSRERVQRDMQDLVFKDGHVYTKNYEKDAYKPRSLMVDERFGRTRTGSTELRKIIGGSKRFDYPKPTKLLKHLLTIASDPAAVVLDFFAGSGSTAQAVMELNAQDDGRRQCILVTNNEVDEKKAKKLTKQGLLPGEPDWEKWGIFAYVARPRLETLVTGQRPDGSTYSDGLEENIEFFELTYLDANRVARGRAFTQVAPLLWLQAGATGPCIAAPSDTYAAPDGATYAVLFNPAYIRELVEDLGGRDEVVRAFIVTNSTAVYQQAAAELPAHVEPSMLYEDYLHNFQINRASSANTPTGEDR